MSKDKDIIQNLNLCLNIRLKLFNKIPSASNMLLAYNLIEEIILKTFELNLIDISDKVNKNIEKFDKLKNLALNTKFIPERKLAFEQSIKIFNKLTKNN